MIAPRLPALFAYILGLALLPAATTQAVDGTITIVGEITDQTCKINSKEPPANLLVALPKIGTTALKNKNDKAGATVFTLKLTDCPAALSGDVRAYFEPGKTTDYDSGNLTAYQSTDGVSAAASGIPTEPGTPKANVQIQLANLDGSIIRMGAPVATQAAQVATLTASGTTKEATLRYLAQYVKTEDAVVTAGKLVSYVTYSIVYP